jgi:hemolysin activation/secretion protein
MLLCYLSLWPVRSAKFARHVLLVLWLLVSALLCVTPAHAQDARFDVFEYRVEGATLLPAMAVERAVYPHLGENKSLTDVESAREALEKAYHEAGYLTVLVTIPQQKVDGGVVTLAVTEAPVDRLRVVESRYFSLDQIKAGVPELAEGNVPNFSQMQTELAALNRSPDRRITPVLRPGKTPGTVEVDLKVADSLPLHGNIEVNNRYSQDTTPTRLAAGLRWDNLWGMQHSLGLSVQSVPENPEENRVLSVNYTWPLASGDFLAFYAVKSDSDVAAVGTLNVVGKGTILGTRYIMPLPGSDSFFQTMTLGADYKDFTQAVNLIGSGGFNTPITYMPFTMGWDANWLGETQSTKLGVAFNFHMRGLVGDEQQFADKRYKGKSSYGYLRGNLSHSETLASDWNLSARSSWQVSPQPLISNEQFTIGGVDTVRGYLESAAAGETGIALSLEVTTPSFAKRVSESLDDLRMVAFLDGGSVSVLDSISADSQYDLAGAGLGLRLKGWRGLTMGLDWAVALNALGKTKQGDNHLYFKLGYDW